MLIVLSPAKTLEINNACKAPQKSQPEYKKQAGELVSKLKEYNQQELMDLMNISDKLAELNHARFKQWSKNPPDELSASAICAFKGDVYTGINVEDWQKADFEFAQEHLRILSGLYGVLRPMDSIAAYRLEMGTKLQTTRGENLYEFWDDTIAKNINKQLQNQGDELLINLASNEYFKSIKKDKLKARVITPVFKDFKNGKYKIISFYAKKARGLMSRFIIKNKLSDPEDIKKFNEDGYYYNDKLTKGNQWVFTRD